MRLRKVSRLTALGWLALYLYKGAAPMALRLDHAALSYSTQGEESCVRWFFVPRYARVTEIWAARQRPPYLEMCLEIGTPLNMRRTTSPRPSTTLWRRREKKSRASPGSGVRYAQLVLGSFFPPLRRGEGDEARDQAFEHHLESHPTAAVAGLTDPSAHGGLRKRFHA
jgi:hypothetical protein